MSNLYGAAWRKRRDQQLQREPACRFCRQFDGRLVPATVADHVTPHRGDPVLFRGPLQSLCASCHSSRKQQIEASASGLMRGCDARGVPVDPCHPWNLESADETHPMGGGSAAGGEQLRDRSSSFEQLHRDKR